MADLSGVLLRLAVRVLPAVPFGVVFWQSVIRFDWLSLLAVGGAACGWRCAWTAAGRHEWESDARRVSMEWVWETVRPVELAVRPVPVKVESVTFALPSPTLPCG